ncbi:VOC family protein [Corynebacterium sp. sy039]|uniref:VOC family protein n=1 Tax=Corynebacterium sp. sy039 TaxID=2599641 RepID=UPI0011B7A69D|nr:VOC family protein [Corynebacterium sp. sy039]QDZ41788.1 VOC family protein [Corynebacterium sp. sy039]
MPAFQAEVGMPYWLDLTSSDSAQSVQFYSELFGWEISEYSPGYHVARIQGLPVAGIVQRDKNSAQPDTWITYFLSGDIDTQCQQIAQLGGRVLAPAAEVRLGRMAIVVDNAGAAFGLIEPGGEDSFIAAGEPGTPVWHELSCVNDYAQATQFYADLFEWLMSEQRNEYGSYTTALVDGAAFAGILDAHQLFAAHVPNFWQSYLGVADVDAAVVRVPELGGDIIREPWDSAFGRMAIIADATGATLTICEVAEPVAEGRESDPLQDIDLSNYPEFG